MNVRFLSPACIELDEAIQYFDYQLPGLGNRFFQEISAAIQRITLMPKAWTKIGKNTRRCLIKGYPFAILYIIHDNEIHDNEIHDNEIVVTAHAHLHRNPSHYKNRID